LEGVVVIVIAVMKDDATKAAMVKPLVLMAFALVGEGLL
jgi:hypothetical protein